MLRSTVPTRLAVNLVGSVLLAGCFASTPGHPRPASTAPAATGSRSATTHPSATGPGLTPWQRLTALADPIDTTPGEAPKKMNEHLPGGLHLYLLEALLKDADVLAGAVAPRELATDLAYPRLLISGVVALVSSQYLNQAKRATSLRVLADIPGITDRGQSTDLVGRTDLTFTVTAQRIHLAAPGRPAKRRGPRRARTADRTPGGPVLVRPHPRTRPQHPRRRPVGP